MTLRLELKSIAQRVVFAVPALALGVAFMILSVDRFIIAAYSDSKSTIESFRIKAAADSYPSSGRLQAQYAARLLETGATLDDGYEQEAEQALAYAAHAVNLSPRNFEYRLLSAAAWEMNGDPGKAENELRAAINLAPSHPNPHWRLANLLIREGKAASSIKEFQLATASYPEREPLALDLIWTATGGDIEAVRFMANEGATSQMSLALFLAQRKKFEEALRILEGIDKTRAAAEPQLPQLFNEFIAADQIEPAARLWRTLFGVSSGSEMWNGGFEQPIRRNLATFDWTLTPSKYAEIGITTTEASSGERSLKIIYRGIETTRLDQEIRQRVVTHPGRRYTLSYTSKTQDLSTPAGPMVVVASPDHAVIARSAPLETGSEDWRSRSLSFVAPAGARAVFIGVQQIPQLSYTAPTTGIVWFDDFMLASDHSEVAKEN